MEQYIVSARKYRPSTFATVVGQNALTATLKNAIATDHLAHAYLFCGSRGVGKTSCARIFAKTINCCNITPDGEACNECESCQDFNVGNSMNIIEFDAASNNGVDDIKKIIDQVHIPPARGRYRVFIIDEVHMLSNQAFNAFLKTLEEPPSYVIFILATTEKHKIIPTILSRCQIYDFSRITIADMIRHMQAVAQNENITADEAALSVIAHQADGAMRDALSIFDQVAASCRGNITYDRTIESLNVLDASYYNRLLDCITSSDIPGALLIFHQIRAKGFDGQFFVNGLGEYFRSLMLAGNEKTRTLLDEPDDIKESLIEAASKVSADFIYRAMNLCNETDLNYRQSSNKQMLVELMLIKITQLLSPSPDDSGRGEGLRPINKPHAPQATAAPATSAPQVVSPTPSRAASVAAHISPARTERPRTPVAGLKVGAISINGSRPAANTQKPQETTRAANLPITQQGIDSAWQAFIEANSAERALISIMQTGSPQLSHGNRCILTVHSDIEATKITERGADITAFMRRHLSNDTFAFEIEVRDIGPQPRYWNEQKVLEHILEKHEKFRNFYTEMKLTKI